MFLVVRGVGFYGEVGIVEVLGDEEFDFFDDFQDMSHPFTEYRRQLLRVCVRKQPPELKEHQGVLLLAPLDVQFYQLPF